MFRLSIPPRRVLLIAVLYAGVVGSLIRIAPLPGMSELAPGGPTTIRDLARIVLIVSAASGPLLLIGILLGLVWRRLAESLLAAIVALNVVGILVLIVEALVAAQRTPAALDALAYPRASPISELWISAALFLLAFGLLLPLAYPRPARIRPAPQNNPRLARLVEVMHAAAAEARAAPLPAPPPEVEARPHTDPADVRRTIRRLLSAPPAPADRDAATLRLMAVRDAAFADALARLPERDGRGGAILGALVREIGPAIDPVALARMVATALVLAPEESPDDDKVEALALRVAELNVDAARELAGASRQLGSRFSLDYSLRMVLRKYGVRFEQLRPAAYAVRPRAAEVERLLAEGQLAPLNDMLRPFGVIMLEKIGSVAPVFRVDDHAGQRVIAAAELIALLGRRAAVR